MNASRLYLDTNQLICRNEGTTRLVIRASSASRFSELHQDFLASRVLEEI